MRLAQNLFPRPYLSPSLSFKHVLDSVFNYQMWIVLWFAAYVVFLFSASNLIEKMLVVLPVIALSLRPGIAAPYNEGRNGVYRYTIKILYPSILRQFSVHGSS